MQARIDDRTLSRLRWRCRRGLLENDLFVERFFARHAESLTEDHARGLAALMDLPDNDLLDLLLARKDVESEMGPNEALRALLALMRTDGAQRLSSSPAFPTF